MQKYWMDIQYSFVQLLARCVYSVHAGFHLVPVRAEAYVLLSPVLIHPIHIKR